MHLPVAVYVTGLRDCESICVSVYMFLEYMLNFAAGQTCRQESSSHMLPVWADTHLGQEEILALELTYLQRSFAQRKGEKDND